MGFYSGRAFWEAGGQGTFLRIEDAEMLAAVDRPYLSASTSKAIASCPARLVADRTMPRSEGTFEATTLGTITHRVAEVLYGLQPGERTLECAFDVLRELVGAEFASVAPPLDSRWEVLCALGGEKIIPDGVSESDGWYLQLMRNLVGIFDVEDPASVEVAHRELGVRAEVAGVPFYGLIDRLDHAEGGLRIVDYKTGKDKSSPKARRFGDDHGDQVRLYAAALRSSGLVDPDVVGARLLYVSHSAAREVDVDDAKATGATLGAFAASWELMRASVEAASFACRPSPLCGWCPLVNSCPAPRIGRWRTDRKGGAPTSSDLGLEVVSCPTRGVSEKPTEIEEHDEMNTWREGKPFDGAMIDGHVNMASYAAGNAGAFTGRAYALLAAQDVVEVKPTSIRALARTLAGLVAEVQVEVTGRADMDAAACSRIRLHLDDLLSVSGVPLGAPSGEFEEWLASTRARLVALTRTSISLVEDPSEQVGDAWRALTGDKQSDPNPWA